LWEGGLGESAGEGKKNGPRNKRGFVWGVGGNVWTSCGRKVSEGALKNAPKGVPVNSRR